MTSRSFLSHTCQVTTNPGSDLVLRRVEDAPSSILSRPRSTKLPCETRRAYAAWRNEGELYCHSLVPATDLHVQGRVSIPESGPVTLYTLAQAIAKRSRLLARARIQSRL